MASHHPCLPHYPARHLGGAVAIVLLMTLDVRGQALKEIGKIPSAPIEVDELVTEITVDAVRIHDPDQRYSCLATILYYTGQIRPELRQLIIDAAKRSAYGASDQTIYSHRESVLRYTTGDTALLLARSIEDPRLRQLYFGDIVARLAKERPARAREVLEEIDLAEARYKALVGFMTAAPLSFTDAAELLTEASQLEPVENNSGDRARAFGNALLRFAKEEPDGVAQFLVEHFMPEEAIAAAVSIAWPLSHNLDAPRAAERLVQRAIEWVPRSADPVKSAIQVLHSGYGQLDEAEAGQLFDAFILPAIVRRKQATEYPLSLLAKVDVKLLVSRAQATASALDKPLIDVLPKAIGDGAHGPDSDTILSWLKSQPPSALRSACIVEVARAMQFSFTHNTANAIEPRVRLLSELAEPIHDPQLRWRALDAIVTLAESFDLPAVELTAEWRELWQKLPEPERESIAYYHVHRLPLAVQQQRIEERSRPGNKNYWKRESHSPWWTLDLIDHSSLPEANKVQIYREMAEEAVEGMARAAIAKRLAAHDYPEALKLMWKSLPTPRNPSMGYPDTYPPGDRPLNAVAAMNWLHDGAEAYLERGESRPVVDALWSHAHAVPQGDRSAVVAELARVLIAAGECEKALGVAREIHDVPERLKFMAQIAGAAVRDEQ